MKEKENQFGHLAHTKLKCKRNLGTKDVFDETPWTVVHETHPPKTDWEKTSTDYLFYSGMVGVDPHVGVSADNPPHEVVALCVDWDAVCPMAFADAAEFMKQKSKNHAHLPTFISLSASGKVHGVWLFVEPVRVGGSADLAHAFLVDLAKRLKVDNLWAGFDPSCLKPTQFLSLGTEWLPISGCHLSPSTVEASITRAASKASVKVGKKLEHNVPLAEVTKLLRLKYNNVPDLEEGGRCNAFWEERNNTTACIVKSNGIYSWSADKSFVSWVDLLGAEALQEYAEKKAYDITKGIWATDSSTYIRHNEIDGTYATESEKTLRQYLAVVFGVSPKSGSAKGFAAGTSASEMDEILVHIRSHKMLDGAMRFPGFSSEIIKVNDCRYLNTYVTKCVQPYPDPCIWGTDFPVISEFLSTRFDPVDPEAETQLNVLLAWMQIAYKGVLKGKPVRGHGMVIAGERGLGKTFMLKHILGNAIGGGYADCADVLVDDSQFNDTVFENYVVAVDDFSRITTPKHATTLALKVKSLVANSTHTVNGKFKKKLATTWYGRVVILCNVDDNSMMIMPSMEHSNDDKMIVLRFKDYSDDFFLDHEDAEEEFARELPKFLRWLVDWKMPKSVMDKSMRFGGVIAYKHLNTIRQADLHKGVDVPWNMLCMYAMSSSEGTIVANSCELQSRMQLCDMTKHHAQAYSGDKLRVFSRYIGQLAEKRPECVESLGRVQAKGADCNVYRIHLDKIRQIRQNTYSNLGVEKEHITPTIRVES